MWQNFKLQLLSIIFAIPSIIIPKFKLLYSWYQRLPITFTGPMSHVKLKRYGILFKYFHYMVVVCNFGWLLTFYCNHFSFWIHCRCRTFSKQPLLWNIENLIHFQHTFHIYFFLWLDIHVSIQGVFFISLRFEQRVIHYNNECLNISHLNNDWNTTCKCRCCFLAVHILVEAINDSLNLKCQRHYRCSPSVSFVTYDCF